MNQVRPRTRRSGAFSACAGIAASAVLAGCQQLLSFSGSVPAAPPSVTPPSVTPPAEQPAADVADLSFEHLDVPASAVDPMDVPAVDPMDVPAVDPMDVPIPDAVPPNAAPAAEPETAPVTEADAASPGLNTGTLLESGVASTYGQGDGFQGNRTACGQRFDTNVPQVAHKTLPCGTLVRVEDTHTGKSVTAAVTDRGPYVRGRVVDLSWAAFAELHPRGPDLLYVNVYVLNSA